MFDCSNIVKPNVCGFDAHGRMYGRGEKHLKSEGRDVRYSSHNCQPLTTTFPLILSTSNEYFCTASVSVQSVCFVNFYVLSVDPGLSSLHPATTIYLVSLFLEIEAQRNSELDSLTVCVYVCVTVCVCVREKYMAGISERT